ncbi:hypothetical protein SAMN04487926_1538 [Paraburkholderia steynii]|uniref:FAD/NAD(P)-binding domain-containing protein n=1 Tax=Paraburkholderia steynii TaxID=1245441 RepID=A0A7Z7BKP5_9BURK|nr:FAD-dependent oxidoreductase [Paraburkholderia steynii]SDJ46944.1 hypothetical protein SAMN04487926_1538 [Paraburkholderia steynii]
MAANQVLAYHEAGERIYNLTGLRTGSVRDQMLRAILLTESLVQDSREISEKKDSGLLVIGAGVAGVTCALIAAKLNVQVTLVEIKPKAFTTLQRAQFRRIDPFEYDWPQPDHHRAFPTSFPIHNLFPLRYDGGSAAKVARDWQADFDNLLKNCNQPKGRPGHLSFIAGLDGRNFKFTTFSTSFGNRIEVSGIWDPKNPATQARPFGAVIICAGFSKERTFDEKKRYKFSGPGFWTHNEGLDQANFGMKHGPAGPYPRILISGGGDGAMQDLQRAATGKFGKPLLDDLISCLGTVSKAAVQVACLLADDRAKRAYAWKASSGQAKDIPIEMREWHRAYERIVDNVISDYATQQGLDDDAALKSLAPHILKQDIHQAPNAEIVWAVFEGHTGFAYALNRFLAIFLVRILDTIRPGAESLRTSTEIVDIKPLKGYSHPCGSKKSCHGVPHAVTFANASQPETFDVIILRHGLFPNPIPSLPAGPSIPEQLAPYDLPN